jgi:hypothetical protein
MLDGLRHAPLITSRFFIKLCRVAQDETIDRNEAVTRTLRKSQPDPFHLPRLTVKALLVVEVLHGHDLKQSKWGIGRLSPYVGKKQREGIYMHSARFYIPFFFTTEIFVTMN